MNLIDKLKLADTDYSYLRRIMIDKDIMNTIQLETSFLPDKKPIKQRMWHILNENFEIIKCECGNAVQWNIKNNTYRRFCSSKCAHNNESVKNKTMLTNIERFGEKTYLKTDEAKQKYADAMIEKFGVDNPFKSKEFQENIRALVKEKYGVESTSQLDWVKDKITRTHRLRYCRDRSSQIHLSAEICELKNDRKYLGELYESGKSILDISKLLGIGYTQLCVKFNQLGIEIRESSGQTEIYEYIKELYKGEIIFNAKGYLDGKKEIDIFLPELGIGFEYDGIYWHSEKSSKKKSYHYNKDIEAQLKNIKLFHIIDLEWRNKKEICQSRISSMLGINKTIYGRKTRIEILDKKIASQFFDDNHIQGNTNFSVCYGLIYNDMVVAAMSFGKSRFNNYEYELLRYCNLLYTNVVGGASKLFSYAKKTLKFNNIVSFCDVRWGTGKMYEKIGFNLIKINGPSYIYTNNYRTLESRMKYQKHKLADLLPIYAKDLSEWENMQNNGYDRYWNSGNMVFLWQR